MLADHLDLPTVKTAEIITFNTIALKKAIRYIGRGLNMPFEEVDTIAKAVHNVSVDEEQIVTIDDEWRQKYPELFKYVDIVLGTIDSIGSHPSGVLVSDHNIEEEIGLCYLKDDPYPVSFLNMKELDVLSFVKEDLLSLDNISIINETCKIAGIPRLSPKTIDFEDDAVWNSIRKDTSLVFQMNSNYGQRTVDKVFAPQIYEKIKRQVPNMTRLDLLTFVNALIRPCGKGVYEKATNGIATPSGIKEIDDLLGSSMGYAIMQEPQMAFVMQFCGYDFLHADKLRKIIGKKLGTRDQLPLIKQGWEENAKIRYNLTEEQSEAIIEPFLQCILDATRYSFSLVHSLSYSCISYECAYLRYHYPLEYLTACMNAWNGDDDKTAEAITYAQRNKIRIKPPRFRHSKAEYYFDAEEKAIYRGTSSIKFLNEGVSNELYDMRDEELNSFVDLLYKLKDTGINARQLEILIKLGYFEEFGNACELLKIYNLFDFFKNGEAKTVAKSKIENDNILFGIVSRHANETAKQFNKLDCQAILDEVESYIKTLQIKDLSMKDKIANDMEYTGSISTITGKEEDRPKLIILDKRMLISNRGKDAGKPWGVAITTQSLGSGIQSSMTVDYKQYCKEKFDIHDIIYVKELHKSKRGYFIVDNYERIFI